MQIHLNNIAYHLPSEWSQVPTDRVMGLLRLSHEHHPTERTKLAALQLINPIPPKLFKKLVAWQINELIQTLDWVWETDHEGQPFEHFEHKDQRYYLPAPLLRTVTFSEWLTAIVYLFQAYYDAETPRQDSTARLIATLCRPMLPGISKLDPTYAGDLREPFNEHTVEARSHLLRDLPVGIIASIVQYFVTDLRWLYDHYDVFEPSTPSSNWGRDGEGAAFDWQATLLSMKNLRYIVAEERIFGTVSEVNRAPITEVFDALEHLKQNQQPNTIRRQEDFNHYSDATD